jgi:predicted dehydrogenase
MNGSPNPDRRDMLLTTGTLAAGVLAGVAVPAVHAAGSEEIKVALVGCGGRGTGAAENALRTKSGPIKLYAMADVFKDRLDGSHNSLNREFKKQMDVPIARRFIGFDAYKHAMDALKPGDVVIFATPPAFRWVHFTYAIKKGLNVFMEKPVTVDGPSSRRMLKLGEESVKKGLKVSVGLMCRHCENRQQLYDKVKKGELGDILTLQAYRMHGPVGTCHVGKKPPKMSELHYQIRNFHAFLWASGGCYSDFLIHNLDECCWMKDGWPVEARASGGRHYRGDKIDQNFDTYSVEYTFEDGTKLFLEGRTISGCEQRFASYLHGTKGSAVISKNSHNSGRCPVYKNQKIGDRKSQIWIGKRDEFASEATNPYQVEWNRLIEAIRLNKDHNEVKRGVEASLVTAMGRMAAHTGQVWTYKDALAHEFELAPNVDKLTLDGQAPLVANADGIYPVPTPGKKGGKVWQEYYV